LLEPLEDVLRCPLLDLCWSLLEPLEDVLRWLLPPRRSFLPLDLRFFWPRRCEELDWSEFLKMISFLK
jgi:hypothetical protein